MDVVFDQVRVNMHSVFESIRIQYSIRIESLCIQYLIGQYPLSVDRKSDQLAMWSLLLLGLASSCMHILLA